MSYGLQIFDQDGNLSLNTDDFTFRYIGRYSFANDPVNNVIIPITDVVPGIYFAVCETGFAIVETGQVRVFPQFGSGTFTNSFDLFRI